MDKDGRDCLALKDKADGLMEKRCHAHVSGNLIERFLEDQAVLPEGMVPQLSAARNYLQAWGDPAGGMS
jgi:hypothetical protein